MNDEEKLVHLIRDAAQDGSEQPGQTIHVSGNGNVVAGGNVVAISPTIKKVVKPDPQGTITPAQKADLQERVKAWITTHNAVKKRELTFAAAWGRLNKYMKVNSYHEINAGGYDKAVKWLTRQKGQIQSMKSAPKKVPTFRKDAYRAIHARGRQLGDKDLYRAYIAKNFDKTSLKDLTDEELQRTRQWILRKKM